ncbi:hypothetical protein D3C80_1867030 [compost metagenome]
MRRRRLALSVGQDLDKLGIHHKQQINIWFDNVVWKDGKITVREYRKTSKEFLSGMMGVEYEAVEQVTKGLRMNGMKKVMAEKKAKSFVNRVKRRCVDTLHRLFISHKEDTQQ